MNAVEHPIHEAAQRGDLAEVQRLITEDPSLIELRGLYDRTPVIYAAWGDHAAIVEWLLNYGGADIEAQDSDGETGLHYGSRYGHREVMSTLLNRGADIKRADRNSHSHLMTAAWNGHIGVVPILVSQEGIDLDAQDRYGDTALLDASSRDRKKVMRLLWAAGADPRIARNNGRTPLGEARERGHRRCIALLEAALAGPELVRLLHRVRAINDGHHAIDKVARETAGKVESKRKMIAAAPAYLKERVEISEELPQEKLVAVVERMVMDGQVPTEVVVELMEMMIPKWDDERRRR